MDSKQFIDVLKAVVRDSALSQELAVLSKPPGRHPPRELLDRSTWYNSLPENEREILHSIIKDVADRSVFGFLCVIDGVRAIEDNEEKGKLELRYLNRNDQAVLLNPSDKEMLHDLWNSL